MPSESFDSAVRRIPRRFALAAFALSLAGCATANANVAPGQPKKASEPKVASVAPTRPQAPSFRASHAPPRRFDGVASYYSEDLHVATGARFDPNGLTAAHRSLPFGTRVRVSDPSTRRSVVVTINDRGPFVPGRVLDLSLGAARALGMQGRGVARVHGEVCCDARGGAPKTLTLVKTPKVGEISVTGMKRPIGNLRFPPAERPGGAARTATLVKTPKVGEISASAKRPIGNLRFPPAERPGGAAKTATHVKTPKAGEISVSDMKRPMGNLRFAPAERPGGAPKTLTLVKMPKAGEISVTGMKRPMGNLRFPPAERPGGAPKTLTLVKTPKAGEISTSGTKRPMGNVRRPAALRRESRCVIPAREVTSCGLGMW